MRNAQVFAQPGLRYSLDGDAGFGVLATGHSTGFRRDRGSPKSFADCQSYHNRLISPDVLSQWELLLRAERAGFGASYVLLAFEHWTDKQPCSGIAGDDGGFLLSFVCLQLPCAGRHQLSGPEPSVDALRRAFCAGD